MQKCVALLQGKYFTSRSTPRYKIGYRVDPIFSILKFKLTIKDNVLMSLVANDTLNYT